MPKSFAEETHICLGKHSFDHMPKLHEFQSVSELYKLLSDSSRIRIFWILCHCEECVLHLSEMMDMSSPAISHHLKQLRAAGLILSRREGKEVYYRAAATKQVELLHQMIETIVQITCPESETHSTEDFTLTE